MSGGGVLFFNQSIVWGGDSGWEKDFLAHGGEGAYVSGGRKGPFWEDAEEITVVDARCPSTCMVGRMDPIGDGPSPVMSWQRVVGRGWSDSRGQWGKSKCGRRIRGGRDVGVNVMAMTKVAAATRATMLIRELGQASHARTSKRSMQR